MIRNDYLFSDTAVFIGPDVWNVEIGLKHKLTEFENDALVLANHSQEFFFFTFLFPSTSTAAL